MFMYNKRFDWNQLKTTPQNSIKTTSVQVWSLFPNMVVTPRFAPVVEQLTHVLVPGNAFSLSGLIASLQWMQGIDSFIFF